VHHFKSDLAHCFGGCLQPSRIAIGLHDGQYQSPLSLFSPSIDECERDTERRTHYIPTQEWLYSETFKCIHSENSLLTALNRDILKTYLFNKISFPCTVDFFYLLDCLTITGLDRTYYAHHLLCGRLSWLPVSFLLHVKYPLSYCIVAYTVLIIISKTMFMVLSSWQSHCESSAGSFDECRTAPSGRRPKTKPDDLGCQSACTGCQSLHPPSPFIIITCPKADTHLRSHGG